jgi:hypothetical protein
MLQASELTSKSTRNFIGFPLWARTSSWGAVLLEALVLVPKVRIAMHGT